jgi:two-component system NtrC family sensor kinase
MVDHVSRPIFRQLLPVTVVSIGVAVLLVSAFWHFENKSNKARFFELAHQRIVAIRANVSIALDSVNLITGHFESVPRDTTTRAGFKLVVDKTLAQHKFVQGYSWDPLVPLSRLAEFEEMAVKDGLAGFRIKERSSEGKLTPVAPRPEYVPVYYMEPMAANRRAIGFDLASNPVRKAALDTARDTGMAQATGRITLVQETASQFGILVLSPAFRGGRTGSVALNRESLLGYVSGVFRIGDLIEASEIAHDKRSALSLIDIHLFDLSADAASQRLFPATETATPDSYGQGMHLTEDFEVAGRRWRLVATPSLWFQADSRPIGSLLMLIAVVAAVVLLHLVLKSRIQKTEEAAAHAREMNLARERLYKAQEIARLVSLEFDGDRRVSAAAGSVSRLLGISERVDGYPLEKLLRNVPADDLAGVVDRLANCRSADGFDFEVVVDGEVRTLHALSEGVNEYGRTPVTLQDITLRKQNEERTRRLERELLQSQKLEAIGTLAGGIAHEINTPIQYIGDNLAFVAEAFDASQKVIAGQRELVDAAKANDELKPLAERLDASYQQSDMDFFLGELPTSIEESRFGVKQVASIVRAMKEFSHPISKSMAAVDLNRIAERTALICKSEWKQVADLVFDLDDKLPLVMANEGELNQVLLNLIVNAAHAIQAQHTEGGMIAIRTRFNDDQVSIEVEDNGGGIPAEIRDKIFEPFFTTKDVGKGTGQGLTIAWDIIVNKHKGAIECHDRAGGGTIFALRLPNTVADDGTVEQPYPTEADPLQRTIMVG